MAGARGKKRVARRRLKPLTLECAPAALVGSLAARRWHSHNVPLDVQQEVAQVDADVDMVGRVGERRRVHIWLVNVPQVDLRGAFKEMRPEAREFGSMRDSISEPSSSSATLQLKLKLKLKLKQQQ